MSENRFVIGEAIRFGWETMKKNIGFFIVILIIAFLIENIPNAIATYAGNDFPLISYVLLLMGWILGFVVQMGLVKISLQFCDNIKGKLDDLLSSFDILLPFIAASLLYGLIVLGGIMLLVVLSIIWSVQFGLLSYFFGGFILLIVPAIIWGIQFSLYPYFIVEKRLGPIEALKASSRATKGAKWDLFLFWLLLVLINIAGFLVFVVGLFATIPTSMIAYAYVYRKLTKESDPSGLTYEV